MTKLLANEIPCLIPGAKPVMNVLPCDQDIYNSTVNNPAQDIYTPFSGTAFETGVTYYERSGAGIPGDAYVYTATTDDTFNVKKTYFTKTTIAAETTKNTTVYERYTDGYWTEMFHGYPRMIEHPIEILKTVSAGSDTHTTVSRFHAIGYWKDRLSLDYVPITRRLESNGYGESARMFR